MFKDKMALVILMIAIVLLGVSCTVAETLPTATSIAQMPPPITSTGTPLPTAPFPSPTIPMVTPTPTVVEPGLAYGYPCVPPCWRGIIPGQSTGDDIKVAIDNLQQDGWASHVRGGIGAEIMFPRGVGGYSIQPGNILVDIENDKAQSITGNIQFNHTIDELIEQFGPPEKLYARLGGLYNCDSCQGWEPPPMYELGFDSLQTYLLYPNEGFVFAVHVEGDIPGGFGGCICPRMRVARFCYFEPMPLSRFMDQRSKLCWSGFLGGIFERDLDDWHGFGGGYE